MAAEEGYLEEIRWGWRCARRAQWLKVSEYRAQQNIDQISGFFFVFCFLFFLKVLF